MLTLSEESKDILITLEVMHSVIVILSPLSLFHHPVERLKEEHSSPVKSKLIIFHVPQHTSLGEDLIVNTALFVASPFTTGAFSNNGPYENADEVNTWIKNKHRTDEFSLH